MSGKKESEIAPEELSELEAQLAGTFKPIAPSRTVVSGIQRRIRIPEPRLIADRMRDWQRLFAIFTGVLSVTLLLITTVRALFFFFRKARAS